jgi:hypothetical protein
MSNLLTCPKGLCFGETAGKRVEIHRQDSDAGDDHDAAAVGGQGLAVREKESGAASVSGGGFF